jgi:hypothetical protein
MGATAMTIEIHELELENLMQEEIGSGRFQSIDDLLTQALYALRERAKIGSGSSPQLKPKKNFAQFLMESPLRGSGLKLERQKDQPRPIDL